MSPFWRKCTLLALVLLPFTTEAQDLHFTNYKFAPMLVNPAKTGAFYGTFRINGIYRDQFDAFIQKGFKTTLLNVDGTLRLGFAEHHWVGWGVDISSDKSGDLGFKNNMARISAAYHASFDKDYKNVVTLGVQYGSVQRRINQIENARFGDYLQEFHGGNPTFTSPDMQMFENYNESFTDLNIGIQYRGVLSDRTGVEIGGAVYHILGSERDRVQGNQQFMRINGHASMRIQTSDNFIVEPAFYSSFSQGFNDIAIQLTGELLLRKLDQTILMFGAGYRVGDALQILVGMQYKKVKVGVAYDVTMSSASVYNSGRGGFEIGAQYIINVFKRPDPDPVFFCPRF